MAAVGPIRRYPAVTFDRGRSVRARAWTTRLAELYRALGASHPPRQLKGPRDLGPALAGVVDLNDRGQIWLTLAVLSGVLPDTMTVTEVARRCQIEGAAALGTAVKQATTRQSIRWRVRVADGQTLVDLGHTVTTNLSTGIQRVARETARRWLRDHECVPVAWLPDFPAMRALTEAEHTSLISGIPTADDEQAPEPDVEVIVPWRGTYLLPELAAEPPRAERLQAMAETATVHTGVIGFDLVPITSAETTATGMAGVFARNLAAVRSFDAVATISGAAGDEYSGWATMLGAIGRTGPRISVASLPVEAPVPSPEALAAARAQFLVADLPMVLVVGSHEPRKNHLAVLHAAELLWRRDLEFSLSFIGGNAWGGGRFTDRLRALQDAGRPVDAAMRIDDATLWAAYRIAQFTVFPSLNEGYGLPVAESLAAGTPAITSQFGSMAEIASGGGALVVDPYDDHAIADAMERLLTDTDLHGRLVAETATRPRRTWDDYATDVWDALTTE